MSKREHKIDSERWRSEGKEWKYRNKRKEKMDIDSDEKTTTKKGIKKKDGWRVGRKEKRGGKARKMNRTERKTRKDKKR